MTTTPPEFAGTSADLGFDPNAILLERPGLLLEPAFLNALREELEKDLGHDVAPLALFQIGLLHGLRDAMQWVAEAFSTGTSQDAESPALTMRLSPRAASGASGTFEIQGCWPGKRESMARRARTGPCEEPSCFMSAGYTSGWLSGTLDTEILALEVTCCTAGHDVCGFVARHAETWRGLGDPRATRLLDAMPLSAFRDTIRADLARPDVDPDGFDPNAPIVQIWGPVMVIPYAGAEETMRAAEMIGSDPGARDVTVVVLDLTGAMLDDAFGALALERIIETVEAYGAETIFAGLSPLSAPIVDDLEHQPLFVEKDVEQAIATAFQISESRRNLA